MLACEILVVAAAAYPTAASSSILHTLCQRVPAPNVHALISLHPFFVCGTAMLALGTLVRVRCYRALGRMFTFELSVRADHSLVTTGPYTYVRHPGYTAGIAVMLAFPLMHFAPGSWARECAVSEHAGWRSATAIYLATIACAIVRLVLRGPVEDAKMREHSGDKWMKYRRRVRWSYIPFVY
jgi:protein-S-isoprenylcysteine O-methyltransferase Ste14